MAKGPDRNLLAAVIILAGLNVILLVTVAVLNLGTSDQLAVQPARVDAPQAGDVADQPTEVPPSQPTPEPPKESASVHELEKAIKSGRFQATLEATESVRREGTVAVEAAIPKLVKFTADESMPARVQAAYAIGLLGPEAAAAASELASLLQDDSALVRRQAADALVRIDDEVVPLLVEAMGNSSPEGQEYAAYALAELAPQSKYAVSKLAGLLRNGDKLLRVQAARVLYKIDPDVAVPALIDALEDSEASVRGTAAALLGKSGAKAKVAFGPLAKMLHDEADLVSQSAAVALAWIDREAALPLLTEAMSDQNEEVVRAAAYGLKLLDPDSAVALLMERLSHSSPTNREVAATVLGDLGPDARQAVPALSQSLQDDDDAVFRAALASLKYVQRNAVVPALIVAIGHERPEVRRRALVALEAIGPRAAEALPRIKDAVQDESSAVRLAAASAVWKIGTDAETAIPVLIELLRGEDAASRPQAAKVLGTMYKKASSAVEALSAAVADEDLETYRAAGVALQQIDKQALTRAYIELVKQQNPVTFGRVVYSLPLQGEGVEESIQALSEALDAEDKQVQEKAMQALSRYRERAKSAVPLLVKKLMQAIEQKDNQVFQTASSALQNIDAKARTSALVEVLKQKDPATFPWATRPSRPTGKGRDEVIRVLVEAVEAEDAQVRQQAIQALYPFGPRAKAAVPLLIEVVKAHDTSARLSAMRTLGHIGPEAREAVPVLREALEDPNPSVRRSAKQALQLIDPEAARDESDEP